MKHRLIRRISALLLVLVMTCSLVPAAAAAGTTEGLTRGEVRDLLLTAADDYNPGITAEEILQGHADGDLHEEQPATRAQALVMLSRAFGDLPEPVGDNARRAIHPEFTDIPQWAQSEIEKIVDAGILTGTKDGRLAPNAPITERQLDLLIRRVYTLFGSNLKDDFYTAVNKEWLDSSVIPAGYMQNGTLTGLGYQNNLQLQEMIQEIVSGNHEEGSPQDKIQTLYRNIMDWDARNAAGIDPIRPYLEAIDKAENLDELMAVSQTMSSDGQPGLLLGFSQTIDRNDSTRKVLYFYTMVSGLSQNQHQDPTVVEAFRERIATMLELGESETPEADADMLLELDRKLCAASLTEEQKADINQTYHVYTMAELQALFPHVDLNALLESTGLPARDPVIVEDKGLLEAVAALFTEEHLDLLKLEAKCEVLQLFGGMLSQAFQDAADAYGAAVYGVDSAPDEEVAAQIVQNTLSDYLGQIYVERYFSERAKKDVERMIDDIIAVYAERIARLDWMSDATKEKAIEKIEAITVNVGYPDEWSTTYDDVILRGTDEGGSFFENVLALNKASLEKGYGEFDAPMDWSQWLMPAFEANAYYLPAANSINFPAGILQAPFYDVNADYTENLGGIGYVIAHEITHAFDNNGAQYDAAGNQNNWWTEADYAAFRKLCDGVVDFYDGLETMPGIFCNGELTLSENVADIGALSCVTQIESAESTPDYKTLYRAVSRCWCNTIGRESAAYLSFTDVHAPKNVRGSRLLQSMDEFYEAFDIRPGDGMYLPPEERVRIW